ncbi:MAG TPA: CAP domain-containing protein [Thermoleophilaceae bacterium]
MVEGRRAFLLLALVGLLVAATYLLPALNVGPFGDDEAERPARDVPAHGCDGAREEPGGDLRAAERATLCLLNAERRAAGRSPLRTDGALRRAALAHSEDMVARDFLEHRNPDGLEAHDRIVRAGYRLRRGGFSTGENLATGPAGADSPAVIVDGWMHSPGHRRNILRRGFREIGIGIVAEQQGGGEGATYTTTFGGTAEG